MVDAATRNTLLSGTLQNGEPPVSRQAPAEEPSPEVKVEEVAATKQEAPEPALTGEVAIHAINGYLGKSP